MQSAIQPIPAEDNALRRSESFKPQRLSDSERFIVYNHMLENARERGDSLSDGGEKLFAEAYSYYRCGKEAQMFQCPECYSRFFIKSWCRSRICDHCSAIYKNKLYKKMMPTIKNVMAQKKKGYVLAMLTLTITTKRFEGRQPNRDDIKRLYKETSKLFRLYYGKYAGKITKKGECREDRKRFIGAGWIATLEVGKNNNNLHVHAVVYGPIRQWFKLQSSWEKITGDSMGVDVRKVRSAKQVSNYILKYITKLPVDDSYVDIADYAFMIKGSRRLRTGGVFYNKISMAKKGKSDRRCECIYCNHRLVMDGPVPLEAIGNAVDLYHELDQVERDLKMKMDTRTEIPDYLGAISPPNECSQLHIWQENAEMSQNNA